MRRRPLALCALLAVLLIVYDLCFTATITSFASSQLSTSHPSRPHQSGDQWRAQWRAQSPANRPPFSDTTRCSPPVPSNGEAPRRPFPGDDSFPFLIRLNTLCLTAHNDRLTVSLSPCLHVAAAAPGGGAHLRQQWRYHYPMGHIESVGLPTNCLDAYPSPEGQVVVQIFTCDVRSEKHQQRFFWGGDEKPMADMGRRLKLMGLGDDAGATHHDRGGDADCIGAADRSGRVYEAHPGTPPPVKLGLFRCGGLPGSYNYKTKTAFFFNRDPLVDFSTTVVLAAAPVGLSDRSGADAGLAAVMAIRKLTTQAGNVLKVGTCARIPKLTMVLIVRVCTSLSLNMRVLFLSYTLLTPPSLT